MSSPFPGMDPYLEDPALWQDVHQGLITYIRDELQPDIRPRYHARIGERLYVVQTGRNIYPDVTIAQRPRKEPSVGAAVLARHAYSREFTAGRGAASVCGNC